MLPFGKKRKRFFNRIFYQENSLVKKAAPGRGVQR